MTQPHCRRCKGIADDPSLIRGKPTYTDNYNKSYTITLCRACHEYATALMNQHHEAPMAALKTYGITPENSEYDDLLSQLQITYWLCAIKFDESRGLKFSTYSLGSLINAVKSIFRVNRRHGFRGIGERRIRRPTSIDVLVEVGGGYATVGDLWLPYEDDPADNVVVRETQSVVREAVRKLDKRSAYIIAARRLDAKRLTLDEVGATLGICRQRAKQLETRAIHKLKKVLETMNVGGITGD